MVKSLRKIRFEVGVEDAGRRLDQVLAARIPRLSRRKARVLLDIGGVFVDRARVKVASRTVKLGQVIEATLGGALERASGDVGKKARDRDERALPLYQVIYEDADVVVVDKPAGLLTAPTPESDRSNLADQLARRRDGDAVFVVHRIDLGTSGLLVFARTDEANRSLSAKFREHDIDRAYLAVVDGSVRWASRSVELPVEGRHAVTHLDRDERFGDRATLLRARLETGRTHQIRIHCRHLGHPVLGDRTYGKPTGHDPGRMALHATRLGFVHPRTGEQMTFESSMPPRLSAWLDNLRAAEAAT